MSGVTKNFFAEGQISARLAAAGQMQIDNKYWIGL